MLLERISIASDDEIGKIVLSLREHFTGCRCARRESKTEVPGCV